MLTITKTHTSVEKNANDRRNGSPLKQGRFWWPPKTRKKKPIYTSRKQREMGSWGLHPPCPHNRIIKQNRKNVSKRT